MPCGDCLAHADHCAFGALPAPSHSFFLSSPGPHPLLPLERPSLLPGTHLNIDEMEKCCFMSVASTIAITVFLKSALTYS